MRRGSAESSRFLAGQPEGLKFGLSFKSINFQTTNESNMDVYGSDCGSLKNILI